MTIGPGPLTYPRTLSYRARLDFDPTKKELTIDAFHLTSNDGGMPLILQVSPKRLEGLSDLKFQALPAELSVGSVQVLHDANALFEQGDLTTTLTINGKTLSDVESLNVGEIGADLHDEFVRRLFGIDHSIPLPLYLPQQMVDRLTECESDDVKNTFEMLMAECASNPVTLTTIYLRFSSVDTRDYYEEYLGVQPPEFSFNPPLIEGDMPQDEMDRHWHRGDVDIAVEWSFRESIYELAATLREWTEDTSKPFPFSSDQDREFHYCKSRMRITFEKTVDRRWYSERRVTFRFRPVSKAERYRIEMGFWEARGDERRVALLNDLFRRAMKDEAKSSDAALPNEESKQSP